MNVNELLSSPRLKWWSTTFECYPETSAKKTPPQSYNPKLLPLCRKKSWKKLFCNSSHLKALISIAWHDTLFVGFDFAECIHSRRFSHPRHIQKSMTLNCVWRWSSSFGNQWSWSTTSLPLLPDLLWPGVVVPVRVQSIVQIDLF